MKHSIYILLLLLLLNLHGFGQNKLTKDGLKIGKWEEKYEISVGKMKYSGFFKIIPINTYDTIRSIGDNLYRIKYKGATPLLSTSGIKRNNVSVKDGIWRTIKSNGKIHEIQTWQNGLLLSEEEYDDNGILKEHHYIDYENDTSVYLYYKGEQLYKKAFYPPNQKQQQTVIFYPDNNLVIPNAELYFNSKFGDTSLNILPLKLFCKRDLTILSVFSSSSNIQVSFPYETFPYDLTTEDTVTLNLIFTPTPSSFRTEDTITILTSEENALPYKIYCWSRASHINGNNVETLKQITLSKTKDKFLIIATMGTSTSAYIKDLNGEEKRYKITISSKINLNEFGVGEYDLKIHSCNTYEDIKLVIIE